MSTPSQTILGAQLDRLKKFDENLQWFQSHYDTLQQQYNGEFVAIDLVLSNNNPMDHDKNFEALIKRLKEKFSDIRTVVVQEIPDL